MGLKAVFEMCGHRRAPLWSACLLPLLVISLPALSADARLGWQPHPAFEEQAIKDDSGRRLLLLKGETPEAWTERIGISRVDDAADVPLKQVLDDLFDQHKDNCPQLAENRIPVEPELEDSVAMSMWHCPENTISGRGEVKVLRLISEAGRTWLMTAEGDYPPYESGATPLLRAQLERWSAVQTTFNLCTRFTIPGCLPEARLIAEGEPAAATPKEAVELLRIQQRGRDLYRHDQLSWHATDYAQAERLLGARKSGVFIAAPDEAEGPAAYFIKENWRGRDKAIRVRLDPEGEKFSHELKDVELPEDVALRLRALRTVMASDRIRGCSERVNNVVLPREDGNGWLVYVLTATTDSNVMPLGGHSRFTVSADGTSIVAVDYSAKSCFALKLDQSGPDGQRPDLLLATHLVSPMPWETHVFQSLTFDTELAVVTDQAVWRVRGDEVWRVAID